MAGVGPTAGGLLRHLSWPRFSISTALLLWQQEVQLGVEGLASTSHSLDTQLSWKGRRTLRHRSASDSPSVAARGGVTSQSSRSPSSSGTLNSDSSIFSMEKVELLLLLVVLSRLTQFWSCRSHASRSSNWPQAWRKSAWTRTGEEVCKETACQNRLTRTTPVQYDTYRLLTFESWPVCNQSWRLLLGWYPGRELLLLDGVAPCSHLLKVASSVCKRVQVKQPEPDQNQKPL